VDLGAQPSRGKARQSAAAADVEEAQIRQARLAQHRDERLFRPSNPRLVDNTKKLTPISAELEALTSRDFLCIAVPRSQLDGR
jgi:hypothetical protein